MTDLTAQIRERLDATTERNYPEMQAMRDALVAVLELHKPHVRNGEPVYCYQCIGSEDDDEAWPCHTLLAIAGKLRIEATTDG